MSSQKDEPEVDESGIMSGKLLSTLLMGLVILAAAGITLGFFLDHYGRDFITNPEPISQVLVPETVDDVSEIPTLPPGVISEPVLVKEPLHYNKTCYSLAGDFTEEIRVRAIEVGCKYVELLL